jgi:hypothetical protein
LTEKEGPVADFGVDERESVGASILDVDTDVEEIFEEPENGKSEAVGLTVEIKVESAEEWDEKFAKCAAEQHEGVAAPGKEEMAGFVDHQIDEVGEQEAAGVAEGVEEEKSVDEEPGDASDSGDGLPGLGFGERERHGIRVATPWSGGLARLERVARGVARGEFTNRTQRRRTENTERRKDNAEAQSFAARKTQE